MDWESEGYILSVKKHGETSAIIDVFTPDKGRHLGLVRGGVSRRSRPVLQPGNKVKVAWRGRLSEHLGAYTVEALSARAAELMDDRLSLSGLNAICAVARECLPEREPHIDVYSALEVLIENLHDPEIWPALYVRWEAGLLTAMGYGLDLKSCAATGVNDNLTHVSPRSGRAVSASAAEPYKDKLLTLPGFLLGRPYAPLKDVADGLSLTGYFLETRVQWGVTKTLPDARTRMIERLLRPNY